MQRYWIKVGRHLPRIVKLLTRMGLEDRARYVERATMNNERVLSLDDAAQGTAPYFSTILIHRRGDAWLGSAREEAAE